MKKQGFTLTELIIVIAVLAILAAILVPLMVGYIGEAQRGVCLADIAAVERTYTYGRVLAEAREGSLDDAGYLTLLQDEVEEVYPDADVTGSTITGVCPAGGSYSATIKEGALTLECSEHGTVIKQFSEALAGTAKLNEFFSKYPNSNLDSSASQTNSWASQVAEELLTTKKLDLTGKSWCAVKSGTGYKIYWLNFDISTVTAGTDTRYPATMYNTATGETFTDSVKIGTRTVGGSTYNAMNLNTFHGED